MSTGRTAPHPGRERLPCTRAGSANGRDSVVEQERAVQRRRVGPARQHAAPRQPRTAARGRGPGAGERSVTAAPCACQAGRLPRPALYARLVAGPRSSASGPCFPTHRSSDLDVILQDRDPLRQRDVVVAQVGNDHREPEEHDQKHAARRSGTASAACPAMPQRRVMTFQHRPRAREHQHAPPPPAASSPNIPRGCARAAPKPAPSAAAGRSEPVVTFKRRSIIPPAILPALPAGLAGARPRRGGRYFSTFTNTPSSTCAM